MKRQLALALLATVLAGCTQAVKPSSANNVTVVDGGGAYLSNCKMLGQVSAQENPWDWFGPTSIVRTQVIFNMQAAVYDRYKGDTLSIQSLTDYAGSGIALKCY